ncbi:Two component regulator propeller [Mucilaginibacter gossypiicola]|uniref:Two component regulator propeller n=2 Tax=Mucilaginibacter gossypiicola TaxID=551995 RepID=A0A1H8QY27_9SPHI|nr:Two component regulator propeller [Mucilaginibacter gossypiicola]
MKNYTYVYTLFLVFVFNTFCDGQSKTDLPKDNAKPETKEVSISHGPNRITRNIIQDRKGNIWIAAFDGIFRYDGKSLTNVTDNVSSARFFSLLEDSKGNLWFGSIGSGVYFYDGKSFKNFTTRDGLANDAVTNIYEDKTSTIWFGTASGASRYNGKSFQNFKIKEVPLPTDADSVHVSVYQHTLSENHWTHNDINMIIEDKNGKFWFATRGYARIYDGKTFTTLTHDGKPFTNVRSIIEDKKGNIWLGGNDGLWRYDGRTFTNFTQSFVGYVYEDREGNIWTSSQENSQAVFKQGNVFTNITGSPKSTWALSRYDGKSLSDKQPTATQIKSNLGMVFGILEAKDGSIWFGANDGVYRYDGNTIADFKSKEGQK